MKTKLQHREKVIADDGYPDPKCVKKSSMLTSEDKTRHERLRARHENANARIKEFNVTSNVFRHRRSLHADCFHSVAVIVQLSITYDRPLYAA